MTGKQLKNSILQWAIQGKLVPQDPNDEPASVLLEKIRAEKARLIKEGKIKRDKKESIIYRGEDNSYYEKFADGKVVCIDDEIPYSLPLGWTWCRLNELGIYRKGPFGSSLTKSMFVPKSEHSIKVYEQKNAIQKDYRLGEYYISEDKFAEMQSFVTKPSDIIVSCAGTIGETYLLPEEAPIGIINQALMRVELYNLDIADYWQLFFAYILLIENEMKGAGSAIKNIPPFEYLKAILIPIPPLQEQKRLIEKYNELTKLICQYTQQKDALDLLNGNLYPSIKKSILQEAIQGKLVPQNPNDEPASVLLQRIREEKLQLVKEGKLKKKDVVDSVIFKGDDNKYYEQIGKTVTDISEEIPFNIPDKWAWSRLSGVVNIIMGQSPDGNDVFEADKVNDAYEFHQGKISFTDKYIAPSGKWCRKPPRIADIGSLLVCVRAPIGDVNITQRQIGIGRGLAAITGYKGIAPDFLFYWLLAHKRLLIDKGTGSTFKAITVEVLKDLIIPLPPLVEQQRIVSQIKKLYDRIKGI